MEPSSQLWRFVAAAIAVAVVGQLLYQLISVLFMPLVVLIVLGIIARLVWFYTSRW